MEITFEGKRALVSGATRGIGREIAKRLVKCGATVVALGTNEELLESLKGEEPSIQTITVDLSSWTETKNALKNVGNIDLLVNNAGVAIIEPLEEVTEEHIDKSFNVNVKAIINLTQMVAGNLKERKQPGSIVNISSIAGIGALPNHTVYSATKGAVDSFTRAAAYDLGPYNIRVNSVNPTVIMTDMGKLVWTDPIKSTPLLNRTPLKRFGEVHEVVDAVLYLLSEKASMISGITLPVDGGYSAS